MIKVSVSPSKHQVHVRGIIPVVAQLDTARQLSSWSTLSQGIPKLEVSPLSSGPHSFENRDTATELYV